MHLDNMFKRDMLKKITQLKYNNVIFQANLASNGPSSKPGSLSITKSQALLTVVSM